MSIFAYTGLPRSGKSYNAVANVIIPALRAGRRVVTNLPVYEDKLREVVTTGEIVMFPTIEVAQEPERIKEFVTPGTVFVLDEVWRIWPAGQKVKDVPEAFLSLLAEHGHMVDVKGDAVSITLLVQDLTNIGSFARKLVEQTFIHTKLTVIGMSKRFRCDMYAGAIGGQSGAAGKLIRQTFGTYEEKIYRCYKSHTMSEAATDGGNEKHTDSRASIFKRPLFIATLILAPLMVIGGVYKCVAFFRHPAMLQNLRAESAANSVQAGLRDFAPGMQPPKSPAVAINWRVIGWAKNNDDPTKSTALLLDVRGRVQSVPYSNCRVIAGEPLQCELEGRFYSETGKSESSAVNKPL